MGRQARSMKANECAVVEGLEGRILLAGGLPLAFEKVAGLGGEARDVEVVGGLAYLETANGLSILDVSVPGTIVKRGEVALPSEARAVTVVGTHAYVAAGSRGLEIIDISDPAAPQLVGAVTMPKEWAGAHGLFVEDVAVAGTYAYLVGGFVGLQVVDISNPANPMLAGEIDVGQGQSIVVAGSYAYVASWGVGLQILSIAEPARPALVKTCDTPGNAYDVSVAGSYAYVADWSDGLQIIDISRPTAPVRVGSYQTSEPALEVSVAGRYAYVPGPRTELGIIDVSNPTSPLLVGEYDGQSTPLGLSAIGQRVYAAGHSGLEIIDVSTPASPALAGRYGLLTDVSAVSVRGSYAYVASDGLNTIDISNPASPVLLASYHMTGGASDVVVAGSYAYVAGGTQGLLIFDISNPAAPVQVGSVDAGDAQQVTLVGSYAYVAGGFWGLQIVDVSDPTAPERVYPSDWQGYGDPIIRDVAVQGDYAYVATYDHGLQVVDISFLEDIRVVGQCNLGGGWADGIAVHGSYAYVATQDEGVVVVDIGDPTRPVMVGSYGRGTMPNDVTVDGSYLYVTGGVTGLQAMDIRDPASLMRVPPYDHGGGSRQVAVVGEYLYLANGFGGLHVVRTCPTVFAGTDGNDSYVVRMAADGVTVEIFANVPTSGAPSCRIGRSALTGLRFDSGGGNDTVVNLTDVPCTILGGTGDDSLTGGDGVDSIDGGDGNDAITGGAGDDSIVAAAGMDTVVSGAGADLVVVDTEASFIPDGDDHVTSATPLLLGDGKTQRFTDADGDRVTVKLSGHGSGELRLGPDRNVSVITLAGTDAASVLTISVSGPQKWTTVGQIDLGAGQLKRLAAPRVDLVGTGITSTAGTIGSIRVRDLQNGAGIELPGTELAAGDTSLAARAIGGESSISFGARLNTVTMDRMDGGDFAAPSIGKLQVGRPGSRWAMFRSNVTLTDPATAGGYTLGSASINGYLDGGTWDIAGRTGTIAVLDVGFVWRAKFGGLVDRIRVRGTLDGRIRAQAIGTVSVGRDMRADLELGSGGSADAMSLRSLSVGGTIEYNTLRAEGDIGSLIVGAMRGAHVYAGYDGDFVPATQDEFASVRRIGKVQVKGIKGRATAFSNSQIAAAEIGGISVAFPDESQQSQIATGVLGVFSVKRLVDGRVRTVVRRDMVEDVEEDGVSVDVLE